MPLSPNKSLCGDIFAIRAQIDQSAMDYENRHQNIFGLLVVLELKVESSTILILKVIFYDQNWWIHSDFFFIEEYKKGGPTFITDIFG